MPEVRPRLIGLFITRSLRDVADDRLAAFANGYVFHGDLLLAASPVAF